MPEEKEEFFNQLVKDHHASIYRICRAYLYDTSHADDLYQEILYQVWKSLKSFKGNSSISTWIYRISVNTAISFNAKQQRNQHEPMPGADQIPYENTLIVKQEEEARLDHLRFCISKLERQDRLVISLVLEDKSYQEISEIIGTNSNNVGVKINRIKTRLLKLMEQK
jgi:RNA polymerase sigma factor (sigma-70 family)